MPNMRITIRQLIKEPCRHPPIYGTMAQATICILKLIPLQEETDDRIGEQDEMIFDFLDLKW